MSKPDGLTPLGRVAQMMNFQRICDRPITLVTMDHRAVLVPAWAAHQQGLFQNERPRLFRLDAHPDLGEKPRAWDEEKSLLTDLHQVTAIANEQRHDDGGWVVSAMNFGFCSDVITAFVHDYHRFEGDSVPYEDFDGQPHRLKTFPDLSNAIEQCERWQAFDPKPLWIDLDMDFATNRSSDDEISIWEKEDWQKHFTPEICQSFTHLINTAKLITISLEPWFCGGVYKCGQIAEAFKNHLSNYTSIFQKL